MTQGTAVSLSELEQQRSETIDRLNRDREDPHMRIQIALELEDVLRKINNYRSQEAP